LQLCDAVVVWHEMRIDRTFLAALKRCRIIVRAGVGFDHISLEAAAELGLPVCNTPDYGTSEVADHAIALMLALKRGIVSYHQNLVSNPTTGFNYSLAPLVRRLRGGVFGVAGLGRIGIATALRAKAFGMSVVAFDPLASRGTEIAVGVQRVESLDELLAASDVVSLHCPLNTETRGMINEEALKKMKRDAILINTARGGLVDIAALIAAIRWRSSTTTAGKAWWATGSSSRPMRPGRARKASVMRAVLQLKQPCSICAKAGCGTWSTSPWYCQALVRRKRNYQGQRFS
jgi:lactate dehydrogenase-like 2-hydroxyacid dehydrogenase